MVVDESRWDRRCPRCGNTDKNLQVPITRGAPCDHCGQVPFTEEPPGYEQILFYRCLRCQQRYLTPKVEPTDILFYQQGQEP